MIPFKYNVRNLTVRWKTTLLTAIGFTLIVALLVMMLGFVNGIRALAEKTGPRSNVIVLRDGATDEQFSNIPVNDDVFKLWSNQAEVVRDGDQPVVSREIYAGLTQEIPPQEEGGRASFRFLQVRGVSDPVVSGRVHDLKVKDGGRWFNDSGVEVVIGEGMAKVLQADVGSEIEVRPGVKWTVVGILNSRGSPFDSEIWAKFDTAGKEFNKENTYSSIVLSMKSVPEAEKYVKEIKDRTKLEINPMLETRYYEEMTKGTQMFLIAALFIAAVMAIGGIFGLMNTMFASVSQRINDIGVLRVLGYSRFQILVSFLLESLLLALVGGALGLGLALLTNGIEQNGVMSSGRGAGKAVVFAIKIDAVIMAMAMGFTLVLGFLGGVIPALSAMRLKLLDSLR